MAPSWQPHQDIHANKLSLYSTFPTAISSLIPLLLLILVFFLPVLTLPLTIHISRIFLQKHSPCSLCFSFCGHTPAKALFLSNLVATLALTLPRVSLTQCSLVPTQKNSHRKTSSSSYPLFWQLLSNPMAIWFLTYLFPLPLTPLGIRHVSRCFPLPPTSSFGNLFVLFESPPQAYSNWWYKFLLSLMLNSGKKYKSNPSLG